MIRTKILSSLLSGLAIAMLYLWTKGIEAHPLEKKVNGKNTGMSYALMGSPLNILQLLDKQLQLLVISHLQSAMASA